MAPINTYILAPNFTFHPNTSICMGDIIQDPSNPTKPLSSLPESSLPPTESHLDYEATIDKTRSQSLQGSVWAKFLSTASAKLGGEASSDVLDKYAIDRLETIYFRKQPTDEEAEDRVKDSKVRAAVNSGIFGKRLLYMITGLKVARGFRLESGAASQKTAEGSVEVPVSSKAGFGSSVSSRQKDDLQVSYRSGQDIIFAYQLHVITYQGWRAKRVDIDVYKSKAAFLSETDGGEEQDTATICVATGELIRELDDGAPMDVSDATDGDGHCVCVVFADEPGWQGGDV